MLKRPFLSALVLVVATLLPVSPASAQKAPPTAGSLRFGRWLLESDAPPPARNVMTYEPWETDGMRVTVESTNARGASTTWTYVTRFDGVFRPVEGQAGAETAVEVVDARTTRILNKRDGKVYQVILNVLSPDGNTIENEYRRTDDAGRESVSHATYRRIGG